MKHVAVKSLLSVMLSLIMVVVFTPAIAFADEPEAADEMLTAPPAIEDEFAGDILDSFEANEGVDPVKEASYEFNINSVSKIEDMMNNVKDSQAIFYKEDTNKNGYYCVKKVALKAGVLGLQAVMLAGTDQQTAKAKFALFYDKNCKKPVDGSMTIKEVDISAPRGSHSQSFFKIPKSQSYYVAVGATEKGWSSAESMWVNLRIYRFAKAKTGTTLKSGNVYGVRCGKGKTTTFKYTPSKSGAVMVLTDHPQNVLTAQNSKVKTKLKSSAGKLLGAQASTKYPAAFGVKGKKKYKVSCTTDKKSTLRGYVIGMSFRNYPNQSGASKAKAKPIELGSTKTGRVFAGSTKAQWFKFTRTEAAPAYVGYYGYTNSKLKVQLYKGKTLLKTGYIKQSTGYNESLYLVDGEELEAGTYYLKISPVKKSSGVYLLDYYAN